MRISDWSSDVCSSDLLLFLDGDDPDQLTWALKQDANAKLILVKGAPLELMKARQRRFYFDQGGKLTERFGIRSVPARVRQQGRVLEISEIALPPKRRRSEEHTSELQSLMRISYAVFCSKKKKTSIISEGLRGKYTTK